MARRSNSSPIRPDDIQSPATGTEESNGQPKSSRAGQRHRRVTRLNWRFAVIVLVALATISGLTNLAHRWQIRSIAGELLVRSEELGSQNRTAEAIRYLRRYLALRPGETESRKTLARLLQDSATSQRQRLEAWLLNEKILQTSSDDQDVLRRQVDLALSLDRNREAIIHLDRLRELRPTDGELDYLHGRALAADRHHADAMARFRAAIEQQYREPEVYVGLSSLQEQLGQTEAADGTLGEMVAANQNRADAFLERARFRIRHRAFAEAIEDTERAEKLAPRDRDVILLRARLALMGADGQDRAAAIARVREKLSIAISRDSKVPELYLTAAQVELAEGKVEAAEAMLAQGCEQLPDDPQLELARTDLLMALDRLEEADQHIEQLRQMRVSRPYLDFLKARRLVQQGEFVDAVPRLQAVAEAAVRRPELRQLALVQLARCCRRIGDNSGQLAASEQVLSADPLSIEARSRAAEALANLGRLDEALEHYRHVATVGDNQLRIARLLINRNLRRPAAERDWGTVTRILEQAATDATDPVAVYEMQGTVLVLQKQVDAARTLLEQVRDEDPADPRRWAALIRLTLRLGEIDRARDLIARAARQAADSVDLRLVQADLLGRTADDEAANQLDQLTTGLADFPEEEQLQLLDGISLVQFRSGNSSAAARMWEQIIERQPWRVDLQLKLFQSSLQDGLRQRVEDLLHAMRETEGADGLHVRTAEALLLIRQAEDGDPAGISEARNRLSQLAADYPHWPTLALAQARVEEAVGNTQNAADHYLQAVTLGSRDPRVIRRGLELLLTLERQDDRVRLLELVGQDATLVVQQAVQRLAAELALREGQHDEAIRLAQEVVAKREANSSDFIWLGRILDAAGHREQALEAFRDAVDSSGNQLFPWQVHLAALIRYDRKDSAREALEQATEQLSEKDARLLAAQVRSKLGDMEIAAGNYQAVLKLSPDDPSILRHAAGFYLQGGQDPQEAERLLRKFVTLKPSPPPVQLGAGRRLLAELLSRRAYPQFLEALRLIDENVRQFGSNTADLRTRGVLLLQRPYPEHVREAIGLLEQVHAAGVLTTDDRLLLAAAYERTGESGKAEEEWNRLAGERETSAAVVGQYLRYLLRAGRHETARPWLGKLQKLAPDDRGTVSLAVHLHVHRGDTAQAASRLREYIRQGDETQRVERTGFAASLLAGIASDRAHGTRTADELFTQAGMFYRSLDQSRPTARFGQARIAAYQGDLPGALRECEAAAASGASWPAVVSTGIAVLRKGEPTPEEISRVDSWLANIAQDDRQTPPVLLMTADIRMISRQYDSAAELYAAVLQKQPSSVVALNNLAWIRAVVHGRHDEALLLIRKAIEQTGPLAELLDTRGTVHYEMANYEQAARSCEAAILENDTPLRRFHLALALWKQGDKEAAAFHFRDALEHGLSEQDLYAYETDRFARLRDAFQQKSDR